MMDDYMAIMIFFVLVFVVAKIFAV